MDKLNTAECVEALLHNNIGFFTGVPDSLLKDICAQIDDSIPASQHLITANEGAAVALAAGAYIATQKIPLVYMQNSGLGNAINPLTSLAVPEVYGIPMLLLIGWRGEPEIQDEPQHMKQGLITPGLLDCMGIPYAILPQDIALLRQQLPIWLHQARINKTPFALLVKKNSFTSYVSIKNKKSTEELSREEALEIILQHGQNIQHLIVATTGMIGRELCELRVKRGEQQDRDFLNVGAMGHASQIALGIAKHTTHPILCLDGDGAAIMHMGALAIIGSEKPTNFRHIILNNAAHDSVGGQPTVGQRISFGQIAKGCGYQSTVLAANRNELDAALPGWLSSPGPTLLEIIIRKGARKDIGRPKDSPQERISQFMRQFIP